MKVLAENWRARWVISSAPSTESNDVSLRMAMKSLPIGGMMARMA